MSLNKIILVPEKTEQILKAIQECKSIDINVVNEPILPENWLNLVKDSFNENQWNLINNAKLNIDENNLIFRSFASLFLKQVNGLLIGHHYTSKEVFLFTILFFGQTSFLSSAFISEINNEIVVWSDCAFNISPTPEMLGKISLNAANFYKKVSKKEPNIAFLSYATFDSAKGKPVEHILESMKHFDQINSDNFKYAGPLQFDAAINLDVYNKKTNQSNTNAFNTLIFPDLNSGNISYKVANQLAKIEFFGPFVLGTDSLVCDLSRSASQVEIVKTIQIINNFAK